MLENDSLPYFKQGKTIGCILSAICPLFPIGTFLYLLFDTLNSNACNDAVGWAFLFLIIIGIGVFPVIVIISVPFIVFVLAVKREHPLGIAIILLVIDNFIFLLELMLFSKLDPGNESFLGILIFAGVFYLFTSIATVIMLKPQK